MNADNTNDKIEFVTEAGVTYFSKRTERRILFLMTLAMLVWGVVELTGDLF